MPLNFSRNIVLRPHHINCIFFYKGLGYNKEFVEGMNKILKIFKENPNTKIKLIVKCDDLCANCPNKQLNNICITKDHVTKLDCDTLKAYNLKVNQEYTFQQIIDTIYKNFNKNKFSKICSSCNWYKEGICSENIIEEQLKKWNL